MGLNATKEERLHSALFNQSLKLIQTNCEDALHDGRRGNHDCQEKRSPVAEPLLKELKRAAKEKTDKKVQHRVVKSQFSGERVSAPTFSG